MNNNCINYCKGTFGIYNLSRLGEDKCYLTTRENQSIKPGDYQISNFHDCKCEAPFTEDLSLQQPSVFYRDGYGWTSNNGCNVDNDSKLRNARNLTNYRYVQQLFERPYTTVPYMGRGVGDVCVESELRPGEDTFQNRPCNNLAGIYIDRFDPQIPCIRDTIQNPIHLVQEDNDVAWIRGGQPSRQVIRNKDYLQKCGFYFNGKYWLKN